MAIFWGHKSLINIINLLSKGRLSTQVFAALTKYSRALADLQVVEAPEGASCINFNAQR